MLTLLHNPHCSTSVYAFDALENAGREFTARRYVLVAERLSEDELRADGLGVDEVVATLAEHPALLQRPILDDGEIAMIGRPRSRADEWAATDRVSERQ